MPSSERALIYSRISLDVQDRQLGVERQEEDALRLITTKGWNLVRPPYRENDTSASTRSTAKRPVYERLLTDLQAGVADVLVCYSTSRLTRRPMDYERLIRLVHDVGLRIVTVVSGDVDLSTADGRAVARILAAMDAAEAERTGERIARASLQRARSGQWHGGPVPPWGYRFAQQNGRRTIVVVEARAALLREAAARVLAGDSLYRIKKDWNARGLTSTSGKPWRSQGLKRLLVRGSIAGFQERDGELLPGDWERILDVPTWETVRALLTDPARDTCTFAQRSHTYPLSGLLFCGLCDHMLRSSILRYGPTYWCSDALGGCGRIRIHARDLERHLLQLISDRVADHPILLEADSVLEGLRAQQHQLQDDHYDGLLERDDFVRQSTRLRRRIIERRRQLTGGWPSSGPADQIVMTAEPADPEPLRRAVLRQHFQRVDVSSHPKGVSARPPAEWAAQRVVLSQRLTLHWRDGITSTPPSFAVTAPWSAPD